MAKASKSAAPYVESIYIREDGPNALSVIGRFTGEDAPIVLARVGEGASETRSESVLKSTAEAFVDVLHDGHRNAWLRDAGLVNSMGVIAIDYDEEDPDVATSYRRVTLSIKHANLKNTLHEFASGDPETDLAAALDKAERSCARSMSSSSVDSFANDVAGFCWNKNNRLVVDTDPKNTVEAVRARWASDGED